MPSDRIQAPFEKVESPDREVNSQKKIFQPRLFQHPKLIPPSTDYMNKSLTCQICKVTINDVESLLVCDACEKGVHLKCLQLYSQKSIPRSDWHCPTCLISSKGKPLPSKNGRVTRNVTKTKVSPNIVRIQASYGRVESPDQEVNTLKVKYHKMNHNDIAKKVQKILQPRHSEHPTWTPPPIVYMDKSITCQICNAMINGVESLVICDACEK